MTIMQEVRAFVNGCPDSFTPKQVMNAIGCSRETAKTCLKRLRREERVMEPEGTIEEVLRRKVMDHQRKRRQYEDSVVIKLPTMDPIGLTFVGDPHIDDDGCDIETLMDHMEIMNKTEGLYGFSIGDYTNNWPSKLAYLYAEQHTTSQEILLLIEWFITGVPWLALLGGNHDVWNRRSDLLKWMAHQAGIKYRNHSLRVILEFPNKRQVRIAARHDFKGSSIWNKAHGVMRAGQKGLKDHIIVAGHRHTSAFAIQMDHYAQLIQHCMLVGGYKTVDDFPDKLGLEGHWISPSHVTVIDPVKADSDPNLLTTFLDVQGGADYLTYLRGH